MTSILKKSIRTFQELFSGYSAPTRQEVVSAIVAGTSALELEKGESVELAPLPGTHGPFTVSGNSLPAFEYTVFEKRIMEFVKVRVEVSMPDRIHYFSTIQSTTAPERHNEVIETRHIYRKPFEELSRHLFDYFPLYVSRSKRMVT